MPGIQGIIPSSVVAGSGPTLALIVDRLADELGFLQRVVTTGTPVGAEPSRVVIADELRDDEVGTELFGAPWVYVYSGPYAGTQRRMVAEPEAGYQSELGALTVSRPFDATLPENTTLKLTSPLPVVRHLGVKGLRECINEALARIWVEVRLPITGDGTYQYSLEAYPWITQYGQLRGIYDTVNVGSGDVAMLSRYGYNLVGNGIVRTLQTSVSYDSGTVFYLAALVRADRLVYDGAAWSYKADGNTGLLEDDYQAAAPIEWIIAFAMLKALQYLSRWLPLRKDLDKETKGAILADVLERRAIWARTAARIKLNEFPRPLQEPNDPIFRAALSPEWD